VSNSRGLSTLAGLAAETGRVLNTFQIHIAIRSVSKKNGFKDGGKHKPIARLELAKGRHKFRKFGLHILLMRTLISRDVFRYAVWGSLLPTDVPHLVTAGQVFATQAFARAKSDATKEWPTDTSVPVASTGHSVLRRARTKQM